jgi:nitroreductase
MKTLDLMNKRVSIRNFNQSPIPSDEMKSIIQAAIQAPTAGNMMMYSIIKIQNKETLKKLSISCDNQPFIAAADTALIFVVDLSKWHRYFILNDIEAYTKRTHRKFLSPSLADAILGINDVFCAAQNAVIAAETFNIGTCYIGDIMENYEYHKEILALPKYVFPAAMLVFGHYDHRPQPRSRFDEKYVVFSEKYQRLSDASLMDMFKNRSELFNATEDKPEKNYAQQFYNRKIGSPFFKEMNRSLEVILKQFENL